MAAATQSYTTIVQDGQIVAHEVLAARKIFSRTPVFVKAA
jgi:hypothetical protein